MKFVKFGFLFGFMFSLLATQCFGMGDAPEGEGSSPSTTSLNPAVFIILSQLKIKDAEKTLQPDEFWAMMEASTGMGTHFLGEFIGNAEESEICLVLRYLIKFGQEDKSRFYDYITGCTGIDGITPLNELIQRMPKVPSERSEFCQLFSQLLALIKTLELGQKVAILGQSNLCGTAPMETARKWGKDYIVRAIFDVFDSTQAASSSALSPDGNFIALPLSDETSI